MHDENMVMDFFKMNFFMNNKSSSMLDSAIYLIAMAFMPYIMEYIKKFNFSIDMLRFRKKNIVLIEGKRSLKCSHWQFKYRNMFSEDFRALWQLINVKHKFRGIRSIKSIFDDNDDNNNDDDYEAKNNENTNIYVVSQNASFHIIDDIYCNIYSKDNSEQSDKMIEAQGPIDTISIELFSYNKTVYELKQFIEQNTREYLNELEKKRNGRKFIYTLERDNSGDDEVKKWIENDYVSTRCFENMFFPQKEELLKKLQYFRDNKAEYDAHGDPYTLGICLYGPPGTGKTCIAKSIANMFERHLVELPLDNISTKSEFKKYFFESKYNSKNKSGTVGFDKKIILLEDIDCMSDIVFEREDKYNKDKYNKDNDNESNKEHGTSVEMIEKLVEAVNKNDNKSSTNTSISTSSSNNKYFSKKNTDDITLSFILNVLDGVQETPGRIMIMTSNYIQKIDKALKRPGRIDICLELGYATMATVKEFYTFHYKKHMKKSIEATINIKELTPAELVNIRRSCDDSKQFIHALQNRINGNADRD